MNFGIVVEDVRDGEAYSELIRRIRDDVEQVLPEPSGGASELLKKFVGWLKHFNWHASYLIHKALVIMDSDCSEASVWEAKLLQIYQQSHFVPNFPVHFHATKCELETWLLADEDAINQAAQIRGKNKHLGPVNIQFETYRDAKELFQKRLSEARLPDTPQVYKEIASVADIQRIAACCPSFQQFINKVRAC
jgi:hypothetical protein